MIVLCATNEILKLITSAATDVEWTAQYNNIATPALSSCVVSSQSGSVNTATTVSLVTAPASGFIHQVKAIYLSNVDPSDPVDVTISKDVAATPFQIFKATLAAGERLIYLENIGFTVFNADGTRKADA